MVAAASRLAIAAEKEAAAAAGGLWSCTDVCSLRITSSHTISPWTPMVFETAEIFVGLVEYAPRQVCGIRLLHDILIYGFV